MKRIVLVILAVGAAKIMAEDKSSGCGLGWQVLPKNSLVSSLTRSSINASTSSTIAMTLGTSGCDHHSIVKNDSKDIHYAEANYHSLRVEMAKGRGEFLTGFAMVMGCSGEQTNTFSSMTQTHYQQIFSDQMPTPSNMVETVRGIMHSDGVCTQSI